MPSTNTRRACSGGSTIAATIAVTTPTVAAGRAGGKEPAQREGFRAAPPPPQQPGDEEAGDDEEDVDADVAAGDTGNAGVVEDNRDHRDRTQALDVRVEPSPGSAPSRFLRSGFTRSAGGGGGLHCHPT